MARSWQYPRWRRYAMQATMWVVLGATIGLAAFVNHERRRALRVELGPATAYGMLTVRLPRAWQVVPAAAATAGDSRVVVRAAEPTPAVTTTTTTTPPPTSAPPRAGDGGSGSLDGDGRPPATAGRIVTVYRERLGASLTPLEHVLSRPEGRRLELLVAHRGRPVDAVAPIRVGDWPGVLVRAIRPPAPSAAAAAAARPRKELYACAVLPSRHAVLIKLEGDGPPELSDAEVLKQIAAAVEVAPASQPGLGQPGETISIDGHTRATAPEGYRPVYETDPQRVERRLWKSTGDGRAWACADLVPCVLAPDDAGDVIDDPATSADRAAGGAGGAGGAGAVAAARGSGEPPTPRGTAADPAAVGQAIRTIVATRDPRLRTASIDEMPSVAARRAWRVVPQPSPGGDPFPTRAYLLAEAADDAVADDDARGAAPAGVDAGPRRALLAVFHGPAGAEAEFDKAWGDLAAGVDFVGPTPVPRMLAAGEQEVRRLRGTGIPPLLRAATGEQWWLWFDDAENRNIGWSSDAWRVPEPVTSGGASGRRQTLWRTPAGQLARATDEWWGDLRAYTSYTDAAGAGDAAAPSGATSANGPAVVFPGGINGGAAPAPPSASSSDRGEPAGVGADAIKQITTLGGPLLTTEWSARDRKLGTWRRPAPPQYVPGGWLPLLIGELATDAGPFVLRTESFPGHEGLRPPEPLLLVVTPEPAPPPGARTTTTAASPSFPAGATPAADAGLRCVAIRVNGTGHVSRWYFRPDGTPARVDLAAGLQRLPSDLKTIKFTFGHDASMVP